MAVEDAAGRAAQPQFAAAAHRILAALVRDGAALGWLDPRRWPAGHWPWR